MAILGRRKKSTGVESDVEAEDGRAEGSAPSPDVADALALAAERAGEIVVATRDILNALDVGRGSGSGGEERVRAALLETLADATRQLHSEAQELSRRLGATRREIGDSRSVAPAPRSEAEAAPPKSEPEAGALSSEPEAAPPKSEPQAPAPFEPPSPGVKALVTQMAAFGSSRLEIEERLRDDFGLANAAALVAHVLDDADDEAREAS